MSKNNLQEIPSEGKPDLKPLPTPKKLEETYKGLKPKPAPLPPLRRLQMADEVARPLPGPNEGIPMGGFPPLTFREKVFFTCLTVALGIFLFMYARAFGAL